GGKALPTRWITLWKSLWARCLISPSKAVGNRGMFGERRMYDRLRKRWIDGGETVMGVLDDYMVDPKISLLDKTRIQAQVLVPVMRALRTELGREKADALVKAALRDWSRQLFAEIGNGVEGSPRRKFAAMNS